MYYLTDAIGSVIKITDTTGTAQANYSYDPYGNNVAYSGSAARS
jgi:hypothetical protein